MIIDNISMSRSWTGSPVTLYLDTDSSPPYCTHLYLLELQLARPSEAETWVQVQTSPWL